MYIFQPLTLSIALLQSSDDKGNSKLFVQRIVISHCHDSCEQLQSGVQQRKLPLGLGSILRLKLGIIHSKSHCSLSCHVNWKTYKLSVAYVPIPALQLLQLLQYSKLQMAKTMGKTSFVQVYNTCIPGDSQPC